MISILLVEDDRAIVESLSEYLEKQNYVVTAVPGQKAALMAMDGQSYDLVLLDIALKDGDGYSLCSVIKDREDIPVIFLTASGDEGSVVTGFELGADDYVAKPFRPRELLSRIQNALRRYHHEESGIRVGNILIDTDRGQVTRDGQELALSALEYRILMIFLDNRGRILSRDILLEEVWDIAGSFVNDNTLSVYIKRLREKLGDDSQHPQIIKTIRGLGYRMD